MSLGAALALAGALAVLVLILSWALVFQLGQRRRLRRWLADPERQEIPEGAGRWSEIFSGLQRLRKSEQRMRTALAASLERFREAAQAIPDGVVLLDSDGRIEWLNSTASQHFGLDPLRDIGTLVEQLIRHGWFYEYLQSFRNGKVEEPLVLSINGEHPKRVLSIMLLSFADTGTLLLSRDITEIARTETIRRDFIANVSHELRTPLTVISGFLEQLTGEGAPSGDAARGFLTLMSEQAQRMNRLVEDLLTLSRLENATEPPRDELVNVPELVKSLLTEAQALSCGRHTIELAEVSPVWVRGSADELRSAFGNLVSNAVRYTPAGGRIVLAWRTEDGDPLFAVTDTGIGIQPEHIPRLTERFYRVDKGRSTATGGTGLGLAIVKHVLARHQGVLSITSTVGQGSTFAARLPDARKVLK
jgi:two-component system phosphate regulon sensor histidine kinase PhoR